jgi:hypothetical protein
MPLDAAPRRKLSPAPLTRDPNADRAPRALSPSTRRGGLPTAAALSMAMVAAALTGAVACTTGNDGVRPDTPKSGSSVTSTPTTTASATSAPTPPATASTSASPPVVPTNQPPPMPGRMAPVTPKPIPSSATPSPSTSVAPCPRPPAVRGEAPAVVPAPSVIPPSPHPPDVEGGEASVKPRPRGTRTV